MTVIDNQRSCSPLSGGGAVSILQRVLDTHPDNYAANYWLATALFEQNQYADCLPLFDRVMSSKQFPAEGWLNRARALLALDHLEPSLMSIQSALRLNPGSIDTNEMLGEAILRLAVSKNVHLLIEGGVGDFLQSVPFLIDNKGKGLNLVVMTHFEGAESFFCDLGIQVGQYLYYLTLEEGARHGRDLAKMGTIVPCPRRRYFARSPFPASTIAFADRRPILGIHLGGSRFSTSVQGQMGLVTKSLPVGVLQGLQALNKFNIIIFGTKAELAALGLRESADIRLACFDRISESLSAAAQCSALVGSDSAMKTMTSMLKIPTVAWIGDYPDYFRDCVFIGPYVKNGVMKVFRYKNLSVDLDAGIQFTRAALADFGIG
jgi:tetratricopeptide (TPR) repeat protein